MKGLSRYFFIISIFSVFAFAQGVPKLELRIEENKVNKTAAEMGGEEIVYSPGDTILYFIYALNSGDGIMTDPEVVDPVPEGVVYLPNSVNGENSEKAFSINSGMLYQEWPPEYSVRNTEGDIIIKEATPDMITHIRWKLLNSLSPGEERILSFKVIVK